MIRSDIKPSKKGAAILAAGTLPAILGACSMGAERVQEGYVETSRGTGYATVTHVPSDFLGIIAERVTVALGDTLYDMFSPDTSQAFGTYCTPMGSDKVSMIVGGDFPSIDETFTITMQRNAQGQEYTISRIPDELIELYNQVRSNTPIK